MQKKYQERKSRGSSPSIVPLLTSGMLVKLGLDSGLHAQILRNESRVWNSSSAPGKPSGNRVMSSSASLGGTSVCQTLGLRCWDEMP